MIEDKITCAAPDCVQPGTILVGYLAGDLGGVLEMCERCVVRLRRLPRPGLYPPPV